MESGKCCVKPNFQHETNYGNNEEKLEGFCKENYRIYKNAFLQSRKTLFNQEYKRRYANNTLLEMCQL